MNNGILVQDIYSKVGFEERLPKNTLGSPGVIPLPYYFPPNNDWKINTINLILVYDTSLSPGTTIHVPSANSTEQNIIIDWDDGIIENFIGQTATLTRTHTYSKHGIYKVQIYGTLGSTAARGLVGNNVPQNSASKLIAIWSFGNLDYAGTSASTSSTNLYRAFYNAINLKNIPATLSSNVKILERTFEGCSSFNDPNISYWNTSNITNMNNLFLSCSNFNQPLDKWDVSNVNNFTNMFQNCLKFNSSLSEWQLGSGVSSTSCASMFANCSVFNQDLSSWNTSKVTNMTNMFYGCSNFIGSGLGSWNTSNVTNMSSMFYDAQQFNQDIGSWNVGNVTNMFQMFGRNATTYLFNNGGSPSISGWNTSNVTNMSYMFANNLSFNQPIGSWNVSKVKIMNNMFQGFANPFDQDISNWNLAGLDVNTALDNFMLGKTGTYALSTTNYDSLLIGWNNNKLVGANGVANWRTDLRPNFGEAKYTAGGDAAAARAALVSYGWTITDGGVA